MLATGIAWALIAHAPPSRRALSIAGGLILVVAAAAVAARVTLPPVTGGYAAMRDRG
jgi:hypothetical protein